jgi:hypothetical protein
MADGNSAFKGLMQTQPDYTKKKGGFRMRGESGEFVTSVLLQMESGL